MVGGLGREGQGDGNEMEPAVSARLRRVFFSDSQTKRTDLWLPRGGGEGEGLGV